MDCIFCKIIKKEIPSEIVHEDKKVLCFKDIAPKAPYHFLLIPKKHIPSIMDLKKNHKDLIANMVFMAKSLAEKFSLKGYQLKFFVGKKGGQEVFHLHLHLLGWK